MHLCASATAMLPKLQKPRGQRFQGRTYCVNRRMLRDLYASGLSTRQVAAQMGCRETIVCKVCKDIIRDKSSAARLRRPPTSKHWRSARQQARRKMERHLGRRLCREEHVHHRNGNYTDQRLENLVVVSAADHARIHHPANPIPRHLRPERQAYMKKYLVNYRRAS